MKIIQKLILRDGVQYWYWLSVSTSQHVTLFSSDADNNLMSGRFDVRNTLAGNSDNASCPHICIFI